MCVRRRLERATGCTHLTTLLILLACRFSLAIRTRLPSKRQAIESGCVFLSKARYRQVRYEMCASRTAQHGELQNLGVLKRPLVRQWQRCRRQVWDAGAQTEVEGCH